MTYTLFTQHHSRSLAFTFARWLLALVQSRCSRSHSAQYLLLRFTPSFDETTSDPFDSRINIGER
jgi:hypothetical protein